MNVIDKVTPTQKKRTKQNSQEWFDGQMKVYFKSLNNQNYTLTKISIMRQNVK